MSFRHSVSFLVYLEFNLYITTLLRKCILFTVVFLFYFRSLKKCIYCRNQYFYFNTFKIQEMQELMLSTLTTIKSWKPGLRLTVQRPMDIHPMIICTRILTRQSPMLAVKPRRRTVRVLPAPMDWMSLKENTYFFCI